MSNYGQFHGATSKGKIDCRHWVYSAVRISWVISVKAKAVVMTGALTSISNIPPDNIPK